MSGGMNLPSPRVPLLGFLLLVGLCACRAAAPVRGAPRGATLHVSDGRARGVDRGGARTAAGLDPLASAGASASPWPAHLQDPTDPVQPQDPTTPVQLQDPTAPVAAPPPEFYDNIYHRFGLSLGGAAYGSFTTAIRVSTPAIVGAILDLEDLLGVDSSANVGRLDAHYAFNRRHRVDVSYYDIRRSGIATIPQDLPIGGVIIPMGQISTKFDTKIFKLAYRYNFVRDFRTTIGASLGLHTMQIDTAFRATGINVEESFDAVAPLPVLGLHAAYALSRKWRLTGGFEALYVEFDNFDGFILDTRLSLDHDTFKHLGWGIGLNSFDSNIGIDGKDNNLHADIEYSYIGLMLYLRTYF